eukprot:1159312-Pelagomonas_calceolata.AAC.7
MLEAAKARGPALVMSMVKHFWGANFKLVLGPKPRKSGMGLYDTHILKEGKHWPKVVNNKVGCFQCMLKLVIFHLILPHSPPTSSVPSG